MMRVEPQQYYAIALRCRRWHCGVSALARERIAGLQGIGADVDTGWLPTEIARDALGYVLTGDDVVRAGKWSHNRDPFLLEASVPGVFACGDMRLSPVKRVASAVGEGSMAIAFVHQYLRQTGTH